MPSWRRISMVRTLKYDALGWNAVVGCRSTRTQSIPCASRCRAVDRPTGPPPMTRTCVSSRRMSGFHHHAVALHAEIDRTVGAPDACLDHVAGLEVQRASCLHAHEHLPLLFLGEQRRDPLLHG